MENIDATVKDRILTIRIDLTKAGSTSKSGRSVLIATTRGSKALPDGNGGTVTLGLNLYRPR